MKKKNDKFMLYRHQSWAFLAALRYEQQFELKEALSLNHPRAYIYIYSRLKKNVDA